MNLFEKQAKESSDEIKALEQEMLNVVAENSTSKDYQQKFQAARQEI